MDTIKYTEIKQESSRIEIHGDNVEVIDVAQAEVRKIEIVAAAQAKAIAMKEEQRRKPRRARSPRWTAMKRCM